MFSIKSNILYIIVFNHFVNCLVQLPDGAGSDIALTETVLQDTINNLFAAFRVQDKSHKSRSETLLMIHDFFVLITLKDCINLKNIVKLTRVNDIDNTQYLILLINEVLNQDEHIGKTEDVFVKDYVDIFIRKLRELKTDVDQLLNFNITSEILKLLNNRNDLLKNYSNTTTKLTESKDDSSDDIESWKPNARRVYRGSKTRIEYFPFMASVQFFSRFQCGGSIIKSDLVITSSSCLQLAWNNRFFRENPAFLSVRVGSTYFEHGGESIPVLEIYFHPSYNSKSLKHNLAIMRLTKRLRFSRKTLQIKKINIDRNPSRLPDTTPGIIVLGWGAKDSRNYVRDRWRHKLRYAELDFYPLRECREVYSKAFVTRKHFCGGYFSKGGGACNRDAGGPGIVNDTLMGVISFGSLSCGAVNAPTVFTKLGHYTDWIEEIMKQEVPHTKKIFVPPPRKPQYSPTPPTTFTFVPVGDEISEVPIKEVDYLRALKRKDNIDKFLSIILGIEEI